MRRVAPGNFVAVVALLVLLAAATGCRKEDMADQPRHDPMEASRFFSDGQSARPLVAGTVPRGGRTVHESIYTNTARLPSDSVPKPPATLTAEDLQRGRERFEIYCSVCHGRLGTGDGMIVQRGFMHPPSFYLDRLRGAPQEHYYEVITGGWGAMYGYGDRVPPEDRWRIAGYIRALQIARPDDKGDNTPPAQVK